MEKIRPAGNLNFFITAFGSEKLKTMMPMVVKNITIYCTGSTNCFSNVREQISEFSAFHCSSFSIQFVYVYPSLEFFIGSFLSSATEIAAIRQHWSGIKTMGRRETVFLRPAPALGQRALDLHGIKIF
jgi:hypothetical protein